MKQWRKRRQTEFVLRLPEWIGAALSDLSPVYQTVEERARLAIRLARFNVEYGTGGPFGAAIFDMQTKQLLAVGVNRVVPAHCSVAHAEIVALMLTQRLLGHHDLSTPGMPQCELVTSSEPCVMCFGAIYWSGMCSLICGAHEKDARRIGFDEGPKPTRWVSILARRGITVTRNVCRDEARAVLLQYWERGGHIYNPQRADARAEQAARKDKADET